VYGTLRRDGRNRYARTLARSAKWLGLARVRGRLYGLGPHPGMRLHAGSGEWVVGEVYRLHDAERMLLALDRYEGPRFARVVTTAVGASGGRLRCWVYRYVGTVEEAQRIVSGDWLDSSAPL
jgi:gamma-glutamylcyclotransferase (GGCT)/AIG2-like uncharacterized protein YtfP